MSRAKSNYIDGIYAHIGEFSKYQLFVWILVSTVGMSTSLMGLSFSFYAATPAHRCKLPESLYPNDTYEIVDESHRELVDKYIPTSHTSVKSNYDSCNLKEFDNSSISDNFTLVRCNEWVYSKEYFQDTLISDWNIVCENKYKRSVFLTLTFIGTYSTIFFGILSDKFGRKRTMYCLLLLAALLNISICVLLNTGKDNLEIRQIIFGLFRFLCGIASNLYNLSVVLAVEICGPSKRLMASNSSNYFFIMGEFIVVTIAYFVRDYRILYCVYTSAVVLMLTYFWYIPESPRWLMVNEKKDKAFKVFEKIAKSNGRCLDELEELKMLNLPHDHTKSEDLIQTHYSLSKTAKILVTNKKTLIRTFVFSLNWLTNSMIYNGLSYSTSDLFGSPYSNFVISATVELVGTIIGQMVYDRYGRKIPYALSLACSSLALLSFLFIPKGYLVNIMAMVGKFFISFTYVGIYIIIVESYPTIIRNSALSINSFISRFGSVTAPNILLLGEIYWYATPYIIFGVLGCISATLFFIVVPETKNKQMADTIEEYIDDE